MSDHDPIEAAFAAQSAARHDYMISGSLSDNSPFRVYRMRDAHEDDKPCFVGTSADCAALVERHALRAAIAAYLRAQWRPIETARKDGTRIIVARNMPGWGWVRGIAYWVNWAGIGGWIARGINEPPGDLGLAHPDVWHPLPEPLAGEEER